MPDYETLVYHGVRQNLRRVLRALGPERIEAGLTAFEDGASNWSDCFFARAFAAEGGVYGTRQICEKLHDPTLKVPVNMLWHTFDETHTFFAGRKLTRADLRKFISDVLDESRPKEVMDLLRSINYTGVEDKEFSCLSST